MAFELVQKAKYTGHDHWKWSVWLEGPRAEMSMVKKVQYILHRSFSPPTHWITNRRSKFRLNASGWGGFTIRANVYCKDRDEPIHLSHDLTLEYPPNTASETLEPKPERQAISTPPDSSRWLAFESPHVATESTAAEAESSARAHITFIHGIANKPSAAQLLKAWVEALAADSGMDLQREQISVSMVYWADVLYADPLLESLVAGPASEAALEGALELGSAWELEISVQEQFFVESLRRKFEIAESATLSDLTQGEPGVGEERIPLPWSIKRPLMERLLRDVHHYLFNVEFSPRPGQTYRVRDEIRRRFVSALQQVTTHPHVVVSHSMGTVIAYDCLKRVTDCPKIERLLTIGSPLGLDEIQDMLRPDWSRDDGFPQKILGWANVFDPLDPVAGFDPYLANDFRRAREEVIEDIKVANSGWWRHDINQYLGQPLLRGALTRALAPATEVPLGDKAVTAEAGSAAATVRELPATTLPATQPPAMPGETAPTAIASDFSAVVFVDELARALDTFDHQRVRELCAEIIDRLHQNRATLAPGDAAKILSQLRRKRYFREMRQVADALLESGETAAKVRRLYVQALLDEGDIAPGITFARELAADPQTPPAEIDEADGLIGRGYKQWYVGSARPATLRRAIAAYYAAFTRAPANNLWHGINVVALLARAARAQVPTPDWPAYRGIAEQIRASIGYMENKGQGNAWDRATAMEACVALGRTDEAVRWARDYVHSEGTDAFEIASTVRQLKELWQLDRQHEPGSLLIPLLEAELLRRQGSEVTVEPSVAVSAQAAALERAGQLEKVFGLDSYVTWKWYRLGMERCRGIARLETKTGQGVGTGFLLRGKDLSLSLSDELLLLTNAHVLSSEPQIGALGQSDAYARFERMQDSHEKVYKVQSILRTSPPDALDYTLARLDSTVSGIEPFMLSVSEPNPTGRQRLYAIGYPKGSTLSFSIHDNLLIDFRSPFLHYRTPTDPGSSGSPIFDDQWNLIGLHHAGSTEMRRLHGEGTYEANEGIWIKAIQDDLRPGSGDSRSTIGPVVAPASPRVLQARSSSAVAAPVSQVSRKGKPMNRNDKHARLQQYVRTVAPADRLREIRTEAPWERPARAMESLAAAPGPEPTPEDARRAVEKAQAGQPLTETEMLAMEAIVLPRERPVVFIDNDTFSTPESPWEHLMNPTLKANIDSAIPSIGRVELPKNLQIPYGGTGFIVGPGLLMTNRHVAELFSSGLGRQIIFRSGQTAAWDYRRERNSPEDGGTTLDVKGIRMVHPYWDMALLEVSGLPAHQKPLRLKVIRPEELLDQEIVVVGYPAKDWRNDSDLQDGIFGRVFNVKRLQPGKIKPREAIQSFENRVSAMTHDSSTLGGNSGSAVIDVKDGCVVGLHFAGVYLKANYAVPAYELARDPRVVDAGLNFQFDDRPSADPVVAGIWRGLDSPDESRRSVVVRQRDRQSVARNAGTTSGTVRVDLGGIGFSLPLTISFSDQARSEPETASALQPLAVASLLEGMQPPVVFPRLDQRTGYDPKFLDLDNGMEIPLPALTDAGRQVSARLDNGSHELKYHKFSVVIHKERRLALLTASNVDWREQMRRINGRKPTRRELTGIAEGSSEKWLTDERIPQIHQLPDSFFTKDGGAFDKGHIVRREDVCWGTSFKDIQKANGDTFHTTNCSPQVAGFNQSARGEDNWGDLENLVQSETGAEKVIIFAGPVLANDDRRFEGVDERGEVLIQIPRKFWKIVIAKGDTAPEAFGFVLEQDLSDVELELAIPPRWRRYMHKISEIDLMLNGWTTLTTVAQFDQFESNRGRRLNARSRR